MDKKQLIWTEEGRKQVFNCKVFSIWESTCTPPETQPDQGKTQNFSVIDAMDWVIVVPVIKNQFVMVRQWRHGSKNLSLEFPGGVMESGEDPKEAAIRELYEETGCKPEKIEKMGEFYPNPAIMSNRVHFFLAKNLCSDGKQQLDDDEYVEVELVDIEKVFQGMGKEPYTHALMGTALMLYNRACSTP